MTRKKIGKLFFEKFVRIKNIAKQTALIIWLPERRRLWNNPDVTCYSDDVWRTNDSCNVNGSVNTLWWLLQVFSIVRKHSYMIIDSSINQINIKDSIVRYLVFVANLITRNLSNVSIKTAGLVFLLKMTVNKVVQMKYNFDASDPPRLQQMTPLSIQISKNF